MQEEGCRLELSDGREVVIHAAVLCMLGDTLGSNFVGGFKDGVGFALRKCRVCLAVQSDMDTKV